MTYVQLPVDFIEDLTFTWRIAEYIQKRFDAPKSWSLLFHWDTAKDLRRMFGDEEMHRDMWLWYKKQD